MALKSVSDNLVEELRKSASNIEELIDAAKKIKLPKGVTADIILQKMSEWVLHSRWLAGHEEEFKSALKMDPVAAKVGVKEIPKEASKVELLDFALKFIAEDFKHIRGLIAKAQVADKDRQILKKCSLTNDAEFFNFVCRNTLKNHDYILDHKQVRILYEYWQDYCDYLDKPIVFALPDQPGWAWERADHRPQKPTRPKIDSVTGLPLICRDNLGSWYDVLNRMPSGTNIDYLVWLYGAYSNEYQGRKIVYFYSKDSEVGKTYISDLIGTEIFKSAYATTRIDDMHSNFSLASYEYKRYVTWQDSHYPKLLYREQVRHLSQGEKAGLVAVEAKFDERRDTILSVRLCVTSNIKPHVGENDGSKSRIIFIPFNKPTNEPSRAELVRDIPLMLWVAERYFHDGNKIDREGEIILSRQSEKLLNYLVTSSNREIQEWFDKNYRADSKGKVPGNTVAESIKSEFNIGHDPEKFQAYRNRVDEWLLSVYNITYDYKVSAYVGMAEGRRILEEEKDEFLGG